MFDYTTIEATKQQWKTATTAPLFTPKAVSDFSGVKPDTLRNYMYRAGSGGILHPEPSRGQGKVRLWSAREMLSASILGDLVSFGFQPSDALEAATNIAGTLLTNLFFEGLKNMPSSKQVINLPRLDEFQAYVKSMDDSKKLSDVRDTVFHAYSLRVDLYVLEERFMRNLGRRMREALKDTDAALYESLKHIFEESVVVPIYE